jgi:hypothetical protein
MAAPDVPINRSLVGLLALICWGLAGLLWWTGWESGGDLWQGAFVRVGTLLAAFWLALPQRGGDAAWFRVSIPVLVGVFAALLLVARVRVPLKVLIPAGLGFAVAVMLLRPRSRTRPHMRSPR